MSRRPGRRLEFMPLATLVGAEKNPKRHHADIRKSLARFGYVEPMVLDERSGRLVAGHGRLEHLQALHASGAPASEGVTTARSGDDWLVPVLRGWASASDTEARAYLVASNKLGESGGWDVDGLDDMVRELLAADAAQGLGFHPDELVTMARWDYLNSSEAPQAPEDTGPATPLYVRPGELYQLGRHRLGCFDSLAPDNLERLVGGAEVECVHMDPPYGINLNTKGRTSARGTRSIASKDFPPVHGDDSTVIAVRALQAAQAMKVPLIVVWGANNFPEALAPTTSWLVWYKRDGESNDQADAELAWSNRGGPVRVFQHRWNGVVKASEHGQKRVHPTQKPIALTEWILTEYAKKKPATCLDFFCGSGSTLLGCERQGVQCFTADLEPRYVQTCLERWEEMTGEKARRIEQPYS